MVRRLGFSRYKSNHACSLCSILPLLDPPEFVRGLEEFLQTDQISDISWYALYNAVLALGCRAIQMTESVESPSKFQDSENAAWQYFHNAFGVQSELLYHKNYLIAIQACRMFLSNICFLSGIKSMFWTLKLTSGSPRL